MQLEQLEKVIGELQLHGDISVERVDSGDPIRVRLAFGGTKRSQRVEIAPWNRHLVVRSKVCKHAELGRGDPLAWTLTENATSGLGAVVVRGAYVWVEMALLADHVDEPELALAIEAVGREADHLEAKTTEGFDRF